MTKRKEATPIVSTKKSEKTMKQANEADNELWKEQRQVTDNVVAPESSFVYVLCSTILPNLLVFSVAYAAVVYELTTSPSYANNKTLLSALKKSFIAFVCLTSHVQLGTFFAAPNQPKTLKNAAWRHAKALSVAILANSAGTTIIRPIFGGAPQYEETIRLVVPIYFVVELLINVVKVPLPVLQCVIGFAVSWLKAVTVSKLVLQWSAHADAHPLAFMVLSATNLFASGLVLRYFVHYHKTNRLIGISFELVWSIVRLLVISTTIGLVAHVANHFMTQKEMESEAFILYYIVAWFALDKYWKAPLTKLLTLPFESAVQNKKLKHL